MGTLDLTALQIWGSLCLKSGVMNSSPLKSGSAEPSTVNDVNLLKGLWVCSVRWIKHGLEAANSFPQPTPAASFIPGLYKMHHFKLNKGSAVANMFVWCYRLFQNLSSVKNTSNISRLETWAPSRPLCLVINKSRSTFSSWLLTLCG